MDVDYDIYAQGEAELGWLNCQLTATAPVNRSRWIGWCGKSSTRWPIALELRTPRQRT